MYHTAEFAANVCGWLSKAPARFGSSAFAAAVTEGDAVAVGAVVGFVAAAVAGLTMVGNTGIAVAVPVAAVGAALVAAVVAAGVGPPVAAGDAVAAPTEPTLVGAGVALIVAAPVTAGVAAGVVLPSVKPLPLIVSRNLLSVLFVFTTRT